MLTSDVRVRVLYVCCPLAGNGLGGRGTTSGGVVGIFSGALAQPSAGAQFNGGTGYSNSAQYGTGGAGGTGTNGGNPGTCGTSLSQQGGGGGGYGAGQ